MKENKMKTIKVIDLLNKIANGEAPRTIFYMGTTYDYDKDCMDYEDVDTGDLMFDDRYNTQILNDEVEIIEEEKDNFNGIRYFKDGNCYMSISSEPLITKEIEEDKEIEKLNKYHFHKKQRQLANKINELIDIVNELGVKNERKN